MPRFVVFRYLNDCHQDQDYGGDLKSLNYQLLCIECEVMINTDEFAKKLEKTIETPMIVLAIMIIPIVLIELEILSTNAQIVSIATMIDDIIWFAFLFEYIILVSLYNNKVSYTKRSWLNTDFRQVFMSHN